MPPLPTDPADALSGGLLDLNVDLSLDADVAAPIAGAVAANANVAAPIDAAVAANIGSIGSEAVAVADQDVVINQELERRGGQRHGRPGLDDHPVTSWS